MKPMFFVFCLAFFMVSSSIFGQAEKLTREYSLFFSNRISNYIFPGFQRDDFKTVYINSFRLQMAYGKSEKYKFVLGLQYGAYGGRFDWLCKNSGFCENYGITPIQVKTINLFRLTSLIFNPNYMLPQNFYI